MLLADQLQKMIPTNKFVNEWVEALNNVLPEYEINTPDRIAMFVAQCGHESMDFRVLRENLNYKAEQLMKTWPKRFPTLAIANQYARQPEKIANKVYADRMGNGNEASGDGWRYCGRGLIQLTGKYNYSKFAEYAEIAVEDAPEYIETPRGAVHSACWFWYVNDCNAVADTSDMETLTKIINGGTIGLADRIKHYNHALELFVGH